MQRHMQAMMMKAQQSGMGGGPPQGGDMPPMY